MDELDRKRRERTEDEQQRDWREDVDGRYSGRMPDSVVIDGKTYERIAYGAEGWPEPTADPCHDCGQPKGSLHVYSCDMEACPVCRQQFIGCEHWPGATPLRSPKG
jgi:hypothetical protein